MSDLQSEALVLNLSILETHKKYNEVITSYQLYSDGRITIKKDGQNESSLEPTIGGHRELRMKFPNESDKGSSYVILTLEHCKYFRSKMIDLLEKY